MSNTIIRVENLSKKYIINHQVKSEPYSTLRDTLNHNVKTLGRKLFSQNGKHNLSNSNEEFWALKDISFVVEQGDAVGIMGRNGAGKSTLLKILSRITEPTLGRITLKGRVASLLEVGTGFHPELTGRENIYLNGAVLGMSRAEIKRKFDEIVDFAEVEKFLDTPVKRYSSGMYVRLAFAVAAHLEPEILVVDEVLAVGDAQFQKKCLGKMGDVAKNEGRTVLFVSHNMAAVKSLCKKGILIDKGQIIYNGLANDTIDYYLSSVYSNNTAEVVWNDIDAAPGSESAKLHSIRITKHDGSLLLDKGFIDEPLFLEIFYWNLKPGNQLNLSISVYTRNDEYVFASSSFTDKDWYRKPHPIGLFKSVCEIPANLFNQGRYNFSVLLVEKEVIAQENYILSVDIEDSGNNRGDYFGYWGGIVRPKLNWSTKILKHERSIFGEKINV